MSDETIETKAGKARPLPKRTAKTRKKNARGSLGRKSFRTRLKWKLFQIRLAFEDPRNRAFDKRYSVETAQEEHLGEVGVAPHAIARGNCVYRVTWEWLIEKALTRLDIDHRRYIFIDYGSGKGKAMLMASR